ncbi:Alpha/Beta hydrolase protein [Fusarium solani]|uniref:Carboxylic ester hydrolase n=1 Tax=Fusarium solani TaxID=169388 RepID=A0A9P9JSS8_FUSSL|nr:Alpha/Beta hydrolase protein [Fusarium solani]KAH7230775.1 Alpha/Beta hydrolase protein [Fusarium solani]
MSSSIHVLWALSFLTSLSWAHQTIYTPSPVVKIRNGTLEGSYDPIRHQDAFLGVPFAASPTGNLRFSMPQPPKPWKGIKSAKTSGPYCIGNYLGLIGFSQNTTASMSEDCLQLNIIRPSGIHKSRKLPVFAWIPGGGYAEGGATDPRYNGSFLVNTSVRMGTPIIFISFNYRLGVFGMMNGPAAAKAGPPNVFLHDQRQALRWIQENIAQFGGDPSRVTIAGESAGATSVGQHLIAYGGRDEGLFNNAIAQSGGPLSFSPYRNAAERKAYSDKVISETGCAKAADQLSCLRALPAETLRKISLLLPLSWVVDGELFTSTSSRLLEAGSFIKVPLLIGSNRNEGTSLFQLFGSLPVITDKELFTFAKGYLGRPVDEAVFTKWSKLYQSEVNRPSSAGLDNVLPNPGPQLGAFYGKATLWYGDAAFAAGRRIANQRWAEHGTPSYSYFFDTPPANLNSTIFGAAHFQEIPYVFANTEAVGWDTDPFPSEPRKRQKYIKLVEVMSRMWISFVVTGSPNHHRSESCMSITCEEKYFSNVQQFPI